MSTLVELLKKLAKPHLSTEEQEKLFTGEATLNSVIPDEVSQKIIGGYLTKETAKTNDELRSHFMALTLNGVDSQIKEVMESAGLSAEQIALINGSENTFKKIPALTGALANKFSGEIESLKANAGKGLDEKLKAQVAELQGKVAEHNSVQSNAVSLHEEELRRQKSGYEAQIHQMAYTGYFNGFDYVENPLIKPAQFSTLAQVEIDKELAKKGLKAILVDPVSRSFDLKTKDGNPHYEDHVEIGFNDFAKRVLTSHNLLNVNPKSPNEPIKKVQVQAVAAAGPNMSKFAQAADAMT